MVKTKNGMLKAIIILAVLTLAFGVSSFIYRGIDTFISGLLMELTGASAIGLIFALIWKYARVKL